MPDLKALPGRCEEASMYSGAVYIPCNAPATVLMKDDRSGAVYRMCDPCADHNKRRRFTLIGPYIEEDTPA